MPETKKRIELVQIATAKDHLYGLTRLGAVWKYDEDRHIWEPLSMAFALTPKRRGFGLEEPRSADGPVNDASQRGDDDGDADGVK